MNAEVIKSFTTKEDVELENVPLSVADDKIKTSVIDIKLFRKREHEINCTLWHIIEIKDATLSNVI